MNGYIWQGRGRRGGGVYYNLDDDDDITLGTPWAQLSLEIDGPDYQVRPVSYLAALEFVSRHHYARGGARSMNAAYGLFDTGRLVGVCWFATPGSEAVCSMVFGPSRRRAVTGLHRLVLLDDAAPVNTDPRHAANTESWFIARCLAALTKDRPDLKAVVSFADERYGHVGTIYQATNGLYYGAAKPRPAFRDPSGMLRSSRQCKETLTVRDALSRGWTVERSGRKHRYCFLLPTDRREGKLLRSELRLPLVEAYPKPAATSNGIRELSQ